MALSIPNLSVAWAGPMMAEAPADPDASWALENNRSDPKLFGELVRRHQASVARLCMNYTHNQAVAADLTQEVFVTLWRERERYRHDGRLNRYLLVIARNRSLAWLKQQRRTLPHAVAIQDLNPPDRGALQHDLTRALSHVEEPFAEAVMLRFLQELSLQEIAELLEQPIGTVKSRLHRGLEQLRKCWHER